MSNGKGTPAKVKKIPMRQCLGCSEHFPKSELLRVVLSPDGEISLDFTGKKSGRGAYVCHNASCLAKAQKSKRLEKNLGKEIPESVYLKLSDELNGN